MTENPGHTKTFRFGSMLYGIPFLCLLALQLMSLVGSHLNPVQKTLAIGTPITLFIISTILGTIVDSYFKSNPNASIPKILFIGTIAWSFILVATILSLSFLAFNIYDASHHSNFIPQDFFSSWPTSLGKLLVGTFFGGIYFLPVNSFFVFLVRRHYKNKLSNSTNNQSAKHPSSP